MENTEPNITETNEDLTIPDILAAFKIFDGTYRRKEVDAAIKLKDELTPHLIKILKNVLADPETYVKEEMLEDHVYAVMLLGHFREPKAHRVIIDLFSLPDDLPDKLFADICTSDLPVILLNTCGGNLESIQSMILNKKADDYCRISACQAMSYAVIEGYISREAVIEFFNTLFTGDEADEASDFWGFVASCIFDLYPGESMEVIRQAYDDGLIFSGFMEFEDYKKALSLGKEKCLEKLTNDLDRYRIDDIHASMSWWSCFNKESNEFSSGSEKYDLPNPYSMQPSRQSQKLQKKDKKNKRKQAKASKRKNRR